MQLFEGVKNLQMRFDRTPCPLNTGLHSMLTAIYDCDIFNCLGVVPESTGILHFLLGAVQTRDSNYSNTGCITFSLVSGEIRHTNMCKHNITEMK